MSVIWARNSSLPPSLRALWRGSMFRLQLFGSPDLMGADGQRVLSVLSQPKRLGLLAYLAMTGRGELHARDTLLGLSTSSAAALESGR